MVRKYNLDETIAEGDPLHPETHQAIATSVNDLDDRTDIVETIIGTGRLSPTELSASFVQFRNFDGSAVAAGSVVVVTLTEDGTDIHDITVEEA